MRCSITGRASAATSSTPGARRPCSRARARTVSISACAARGSGAPGQALGQIAALGLLRAAGADKVEDRLDHLVPHRHPPHHALRADQLVGVEDLRAFRLGRAGGGQKDVALRRAGGIVDIHLHEETVQLRLGQGVGALLLDRVLRGKHVERPPQRAVLAGDGDFLLLHRLQKGRLRAGGGAVDLVRHEKLAEDRAFEEAEGPAAVGGGLQHLGAQDIGRHQVGGELDAVGIQAHDRAQRVDKPRLAEARQADQKRMATAEHGGKDKVHHLLLADEAAVDAGLGLGQPCPQRLDLCHQRVRVGHVCGPSCGFGVHYTQLSRPAQMAKAP